MLLEEAVYGSNRLVQVSFGVILKKTKPARESETQIKDNCGRLTAIHRFADIHPRSAEMAIKPLQSVDQDTKKKAREKLLT